MAVINFAHREITAKIVYFGATGAGSNTNVRALYELLADHTDRSRLHPFGPADTRERTWYFDIQLPEAQVAGFRVRYRVYSMPGGLTLPTHREQVMANADAIVLVADARPEAAAANEQALLDLETELAAQDLELSGMPVVIQVNQTDREGAREESAVVFDLNPYGFPVQSAAAKSHVGVRETFNRITRSTLERIRLAMAGEEGALALRAVHRPDQASDEDVVREHLSAIVQQSASTVLRTSGDEPINSATPPGTQVEVPFQPRDFAGSYPVRVVEANLDDGQVYVDIEFERMGGGEARQLRVKLANRPTDSPAMPRPVAVQVHASPVMNITQGLPDKVELRPYVEERDIPPVWYGIFGVAGGAVAGLMIGFLLFH